MSREFMPHDFKPSPAVSEKAVSTGPTQLTRVSRSASLEETVRICSVPTSCRPPTASISKNLGRLIFCQACGNNIEIPLNYSKLVVLCKSCHESTPARPPPTDKRFFRCDCGRLILVSVYVHSVNCPRPGCFRRLILPATTVINVNQVHSDDADIHRDSEFLSKQADRPLELRCGACFKRFTTPSTTVMSSAVVCPHCKKRTTVGPDISRNRKWIFFGYSLVLLSIGLTITISTYLCRFRTDGVYSVQVGLLFGSLVTFAKAYQYHHMSVSHVIISGYEV